mgnify:CR=1 FL=1
MVVLPAPLAPTRPTSPRGTSMVRSSSAVTPGYRLVRPSMRRRELVTTTTASLPRQGTGTVALVPSRGPSFLPRNGEQSRCLGQIDRAIALLGQLGTKGSDILGIHADHPDLAARSTVAMAVPTIFYRLLDEAAPREATPDAGHRLLEVVDQDRHDRRAHRRMQHGIGLRDAVIDAQPQCATHSGAPVLKQIRQRRAADA